MGGITERFKSLLPRSKADDVAPSNGEAATPLNGEQQFVFDQMENTDESIFITGGAGTGKSHLLRYFRDKSRKKNVTVVVAPTGIAAINVGGQTIHSFFQLPPRVLDKGTLSNIITEWYQDNRYQGHLQKLQRVEVLIIDEISMVRSDLLNAIDIVLRCANGSEQPFGGKQLILFGDPFQLPPVVDDGNDNQLRVFLDAEFGGEFFFDAPTFNNIKCYNLYINQRQNDVRFINILNNIRIGNVCQNDLDTLNKTCFRDINPGSHYITLVPTNSAADGINSAKLNAIAAPEFEYKAIITGTINNTEYPADKILRLKVGAQVIMLENRKGSWVNGTMATIAELSKTSVKVNIGDQTHTITTKTWEKKKYNYNRRTRTLEEKTVASFIQYPIKLAWALTIHKSQGQTYETVAIDMSNGTFAAGQAYVALSRCRSMEKLYLLAPVQATDILVNNRVVEFMREIIIPPPSATLAIDDDSNYQPKPPTNISPNGNDAPMGFGGDDELQKSHEDNKKLNDEIERLKRRIQELEDENQGLKDDLSGVSNDRSAVQRTLPIIDT